jgi:hypothetical protein
MTPPGLGHGDFRSLFDKTVQRVKYFFSVAFGFGIGPGKPDNPPGINEYTAPDDTGIFFPIHLFRSPGAISLQNLVLRITQKSHGELVFVLELLVRCHRVRTNSKNHGAKRLELGQPL